MTAIRLHVFLLAFLAIATAHAQQPSGAVVYEGARLSVRDGKTIDSAAFLVENITVRSVRLQANSLNVALCGRNRLARRGLLRELEQHDIGLLLDLLEHKLAS